jgi:hypothetical protein
MANQYKKPEEENLTRKERREKALDQMFGKDRKDYMGNIWGWKFSILSLIGIVAVILLATVGVMTGNIDLEQQRLETNPGRLLEETRMQAPNKDTLKSED